ncbi:MAG: molybdopterin oxidoreductase, partial [Vicinamibacterales bacterium]
LLTESVSSPTLAAQIRELLSRYPSAKWHQWDPASRDNVRNGAKLAFGEYVDAHYRFDQADVILSLDADFLGSGPGSLRYARDFSKRRRPDDAAHMNRLYVVESMPTSTGARADHRLPMRPSAIERAAREVAAAVGVAGAAGGPGASAGVQALRPAEQKWIAAAARDLLAHRGRSLVTAGDGQPPAVHVLAHALNQALGNVGQTVVYTQTTEAEPVNQLESMRDLVADMNAGKVDLLVILGGNPVYSAPVDLKFAEAINKVQLRAHLSLYDDETSALCQWQIPEAHFLEAWSDARALDGTTSIVQPLIAPLYGGKSAHELLAALSARPERSAHDLVREFWSGSSRTLPTTEFDATWRRWLHDGVMPDTAFAPKAVTLALSALSPQPSALPPSGLEISFRNDPSVLDGRFSNNGWLQELPKPITRLTWDNAVLTSPATADKLKASQSPAFQGGEHGQIITDVVELNFKGRSVRGALFAVAGHPDDCVTVHLGYGRSRGGRVAAGAGFNANAIRTADALSFGSGVEIALTGETFPLACTQYHHLMEGRGMVRAVTRDEYLRDPQSVQEGPGIEPPPPKTLTLYPEVKYDGYKWGMAIDVNSCIGCNACVVGCQ